MASMAVCRLAFTSLGFMGVVPPIAPLPEPADRNPVWLSLKWRKKRHVLAGAGLLVAALKLAEAVAYAAAAAHAAAGRLPRSHEATLDASSLGGVALVVALAVALAFASSAASAVAPVAR